MRSDFGLYRGRRLHTTPEKPEWVYGNLVTWRDGSADILEDPLGKYDQSKNRYDVTPDTVGQYTGLRDKNGERVFEGDILRFTNSDGETSIYDVFWGYHRWLTRMHDVYTADPDDLDEVFCNSAEIIGNIHDNPDYWR